MGEVFNIQDFELLSAYFAGELSESEARAVEIRANEDPAFAEELMRLQKLWLSSRDVDTDAAWSKLDARIGKKVSRRKFSIRYVYTLAAVLIGFLVVSVLITRNSSRVNGDTEIPGLIAADESLSLQLPDGSEVSLNSDSRLRWASTLNLFPERIVYLEGEAYFDVERNESRPFIVQTRYARVTVLGTRFNVRTGENETSVFVRSGKVRVEDSGLVHSVELTAGQEADVNHKTSGLSKNESGDFNCIAWKTKHLEFSDTDLRDALKSVETAYGVDVVFDKSLADSLKISASFDEPDAESVLEVIALTLDIKIRKADDAFVVYEE